MPPWMIVMSFAISAYGGAGHRIPLDREEIIVAIDPVHSKFYRLITTHDYEVEVIKLDQEVFENMQLFGQESGHFLERGKEYRITFQRRVESLSKNGSWEDLGIDLNRFWKEVPDLQKIRIQVDGKGNLFLLTEDHLPLLYRRVDQKIEMTGKEIQSHFGKAGIRASMVLPYDGFGGILVMDSKRVLHRMELPRLPGKSPKITQISKNPLLKAIKLGRAIYLVFDPKYENDFFGQNFLIPKALSVLSGPYQSRGRDVIPFFDYEKIDWNNTKHEIGFEDPQKLHFIISSEPVDWDQVSELVYQTDLEPSVRESIRETAPKLKLQINHGSLQVSIHEAAMELARNLPNREEIQHRMFLQLVGVESEIAYGGRFSKDYVNAMEKARTLAMAWLQERSNSEGATSASTVDALLDETLQRAQTFIRENWPAIILISQEIQKRGKLSIKEVEALREKASSRDFIKTFTEKPYDTTSSGALSFVSCVDEVLSSKK